MVTVEHRHRRRVTVVAAPRPVVVPGVVRATERKITVTTGHDEIVAALNDLSHRAKRLPPPHPGRPDAFHEARSELAHDIFLVAEWLRTGRKPS